MVCVCLLTLSSCGPKEKNESIAEKTVIEKKSVSVAENLASGGILVVSHRGDWRNAPENSLQAIQNCINMGVDMVEIDLKKNQGRAFGLDARQDHRPYDNGQRKT